MTTKRLDKHWKEHDVSPVVIGEVPKNKNMTKEIEKIIRANYLIGDAKEAADKIQKLFSQGKQKWVEEILKKLPKEKRLLKDADSCPDVRVQREEYGRKQWNACLKELKQTLKQKIKK